MLKTLQDLFLVFTSVLFIVDPLTAVPTFLVMTQRDPLEVRRLMARRGAWTCAVTLTAFALRSEEHTSELQSRGHLVCRLLLEKKKLPRPVRITKMIGTLCARLA